MAHILIVDDEEHIRFLLRRVLETDGFTTSQARDGLEALKILETSNHPIDLILSDVRMPNMDGYEFIVMLQLQHDHPPIIILTAHWDQVPQDAQKVISGRLFKPFSRQKLLDLVHSTLSVPVS